MALTSDKKYLFTAGEDKTIYMCYLENMKVLCKIDTIYGDFLVLLKNRTFYEKTVTATF